MLTMDAHTSDELSGKKLVEVVAGGERTGLDNPGSIPSDDTSGTNQIKHRQPATERTQLIRPRRPTDPTDDDITSNDDVTFPRLVYGSVTSKQTQPTEMQDHSNLVDKILKKLSQPSGSMMSLLLIVVVDVVLVLAANLNTDNRGLQVKPHHVLVYLMVLIFIFIAWTCYAVIPQKLHYSRRYEGTLIPSHLLTGVGIFGTLTAISQVLLFLDFIKCRHHVSSLSNVFGVYPIFKITFIYVQIYFFYKFSRDGVRHSNLPGGIFFVMFTLATNLCIWVSVFFSDVSADPKLRDVSWLNHYYYGVEKHNLCANESLTSQTSRDLHAIVASLSPYISTFSMEYALLASGLLLHIWRIIKKPIPKLPKSKKQSWTLWRVGFIFGLLTIPVVFVAYMREESGMKFTGPKVTIYVLKAGFFVTLMLLCWSCIKSVDQKSGFIKKNKSMKLEVILLGITGFLGFPPYDLACTFSAICEWGNYPVIELIWYGISVLCEFFQNCVQFYFIKKVYQFRLPEVAGNKVMNVASFVRQCASFALVMNIAYWAAKTYDLRHTPADPSIAEKFFGKYTWFALTHFSFPLCLFFYFHIAICYANIVASFSQFGPLSSNTYEHDNE